MASPPLGEDQIAFLRSFDSECSKNCSPKWMISKSKMNISQFCGFLEWQNSQYVQGILFPFELEISFNADRSLILPVASFPQSINLPSLEQSKHTICLPEIEFSVAKRNPLIILETLYDSFFNCQADRATDRPTIWANSFKSLNFRETLADFATKYD